MNLFGINVSWEGKNGKYVNKEECHKAHDELTKYLDARFNETKQLIEDVHRRVDDGQKAVMTYVDLLTKR